MYNFSTFSNDNVKIFNLKQKLVSFNPIPAGGGVNLTPCSFFYITQKVLV